MSGQRGRKRTITLNELSSGKGGSNSVARCERGRRVPRRRSLRSEERHLQKRRRVSPEQQKTQRSRLQKKAVEENGKRTNSRRGNTKEKKWWEIGHGQGGFGREGKNTLQNTGEDPEGEDLILENNVRNLGPGAEKDKSHRGGGERKCIGKARHRKGKTQKAHFGGPAGGVG